MLRLWRADLAVPLRYGPVDDTKFYLMLVKGIIDHGGYLTNASLGAPFHQQLFDYPQGADNLNLLIIRGLGLLSSDPALVVNLFFLLTFALASFTAQLVLRSLGVGVAAAGVAAVLFSLLAYHFFRGESHLLLSAYYAVPLSAYLFLRVMSDAPLFARRAPPSRPGLAWASRRSLATVGMCLVIGSENLYYATFASVLLVGATIIALALRRRRAFASGLAVLALVAGTLAANLAPSLIYRAQHGANVALARTAAADETSTEAFALRISNLILPVPDSRISPLRQITARYDNAIAPGYCEACYASLGTVGTVGLGWLALCALAALVGAGDRLTADRRFTHAGAGVMIALAVGLVGGLSSVIEFWLTPDIRAWNRISVLIAFFALLAVALLLDSLVGWLRARRQGGPLAVVALAAVLGFGVYDQTSRSFVPAYAATARQWRSDGRFVGEIEARLPRGASVFQLPYVPFPEGYALTPVGGQIATYATKYEPLRGYLHSSTLHWSYGATKGRPADWSAQLAGHPLSFVVAAVAAAGFDGIWIDPAGFEPAKARRVLAALRGLLGAAPLVSPDGDLWFFDLRRYRARQQRSHPAAQLSRLRELTLSPLRTVCQTDGLALFNPSATPRPATLKVALAASGTSSDAIRLTYPDGRVTESAGPAQLVVERHLSLASGPSVVRVAGVSPQHGFSPQVLDATLTDDAARPFVGSGPGADRGLVVGLIGPACVGARG